jgi:hypothetical protein
MLLPPLTHLHFQAASLLAQGYNPSQVAGGLNLPLPLVQSWLKERPFREKVSEFVKEIEREVVEYTTRKLTRLQVDAVDTLSDLLNADSEQVKLAAVKEIFEHGHLRVQRGIDSSTLKPGTIILQERMILAMQQVSEMTEDGEMQGALQLALGSGESQNGEG